MVARSTRRVAVRLLLVSALLAGFVLPGSVPAQAQAAESCHTLMTKGRHITKNGRTYSISLYAYRCATGAHSVSMTLGRRSAVKGPNNLTLTSDQSHFYSFHNLTTSTFTPITVSGEPLSRAKLNVGSQIAPHGGGDSTFTSPNANAVINDCKTADGKVHRKHRNGSMTGDLVLNTNNSTFGKIVVTNGTPASLHWSDNVRCGGGGEPPPTCATNNLSVYGSRPTLTLSAHKTAGATRAHLSGMNYGQLKTTRTETSGMVYRYIWSQVPASYVTMAFNTAGAPATATIKGYPGTDIVGTSTFKANQAYPGEWSPCPRATSTVKEDRTDFSMGSITAPSSGGTVANFFLGGARAVSGGALESSATRSRVRNQ